MMNLIVVAAYLLGMVVLGLYMSKYVKKDDDFFLAGRCLNKWIIAGTVMATNVAAIYLVGPAGAAYAGGGISVLLIAWTGNMIAAFSALLFVPRLRRMQITTISEFLEERYGLWLRLVPAFLWIVYYAFFSGNAMYTLSVVLQPVLTFSDGRVIPLNHIIWMVGGVVILYCFFSGLVAVAYTSVIQSFLMILGGIILLPLSLKAVGGLSSFISQVDPDLFVFWKKGDVWPTYKDVIMFTLMGLPYWCTSQYMLQRSFAGRTVRDSSRGVVLAALLTGPLTLSYILAGICATLLYTGDNALAKGDSVLPQMLVDLLPVGLGGLFIAGLISASNSTASSLLNSLATLSENDFYRRFLPGRSSKHYMWVGRIATLIGGGIGLAFAYNVERLGGIIQANYEIMTFFEPPIFVAVVAALFWRRANGWGAAAAIFIGFAFNSATSEIIHAIVARSDALAPFVEQLPVLSPADRAIWTLPICFATLFAVSYLANLINPSTAETQERIHQMLLRTRGTRTKDAPGSSVFGIVLALISLAAFVGCAFFEEYLHKPGNILVFMGLMMSFVLGCYLAIPFFVHEEEEKLAGKEGVGVENSWIHKIFGSGFAWLLLYVVATIIILVLYFI